MILKRILVVFWVSLLGATSVTATDYPWHDENKGAQSLLERYDPPQGFRRLDAPAGSFAEFLRHLPLKPKGTALRLYNGDKVSWPLYAGAIIDLDLGERDLQQCADTLIRLYSEYRYGRGQAQTLSFNFTSGDPFAYRSFLEGQRPVVSGNKVSWRQTKAISHGREAFRRWLDIVFLYAGTASLARDLPHVDIKDARIGDMFIAAGFPGHTVMIADMATDDQGNRKILLIEGFSPAQDAHVVRNMLPFSSGDWYELREGEDLVTPVWRFRPTQLHRMQ